MSKEEIKKEIEEIESRRFYLAMTDRWTNSDYDLEHKLLERKRELEAMLCEQ